ncbi:pyruvate dehydrogenase E2 component (dihydrolipoamide acetyltransferase) [Inquilinus ginsengisoli]|uniref:Acetyltransferase component of pyruvate dehydrogenase complex n=1 Tax=Inquilinus ginsengisoli TaxID=363840 RepID=A0ABU1JZT3_9PROT|nr:pyruvate dehydrogenase complex dihydrolipoamide acetyltransferase [Inquilinus ginsengisoli]MDR6293014.1 pyruvate dehydrogenase E2 component (dihydrolipoamide acetyltransferase) [Inquilinus ginsengisoli]
MTINILMPALSPTMTEGTLATWHKKEGDKVKSGDVIAEIETDKATMEVEAVDEGVIGKIVVPEGTENVPVNEIIAILLEDGEDAGALKGGAAAPKAEAKTEAPAEPKAEAKAEAPAPATQPAAAGPVAKPAAANGHDDRVFASPLARRMAEQAGIDLAALKGTGPNGRVVKADIDAAVSGGSAPAAKPAAPEAAKPAAAPAAAKPTAAGPNAKQLADAYGIPYSEQKHSNMRKVVARRLLESKLTVPHFYLTVDIQLDALLKLRKELNDRGDVKLSVNDLIIKAAALSLRKVPAANTSWTDDALIQYERVDISVAVATPGGLITPIIKDADRKGLSTISAEMKDLAARARDGKLKPEEYQGGTFSISNLGMFGIKDFAAIINPPQACILAVGAGAQQPVVKDGALAIATVMSCTLSVDHRVVDGAVGAEYLAAFKALVEAPLGMML